MYNVILRLYVIKLYKTHRTAKLMKRVNFNDRLQVKMKLEHCQLTEYKLR